MAIGATDGIDRKLVKKYASEKMNNFDNTTSMVSADKMMSAINDYASVQRAFFDMRTKLQAKCASANAKLAYKAV